MYVIKWVTALMEVMKSGVLMAKRGILVPQIVLWCPIYIYCYLFRIPLWYYHTCSYNLIYHQDICVKNQPIYIKHRAMRNSKDFGYTKDDEFLWDINTVWELYQNEMRLQTPTQNAISLHSKNNAARTLNIDKYLVLWKGEKMVSRTGAKLDLVCGVFLVTMV